jgi:hypothetical protein
MCFVVLSVKQRIATNILENEQGVGLGLGRKGWDQSGELHGSSKEEMLPPQD